MLFIAWVFIRGFKIGMYYNYDDFVVDGGKISSNMSVNKGLFVVVFNLTFHRLITKAFHV